MDEEVFFKQLRKNKFTEENIERITKSSRWYQIKYLFDAGLIKMPSRKFFTKPFKEINKLTDLDEAKKLLQKNFVWIRLNIDISFEDMIKFGFVPMSLNFIVKEIIEDWLNGMNKEELEYWHGGYWLEKINKLIEGRILDWIDERFKYWIYPTQNYIVKKALKKADSFNLLLLFPQFVYKESKRPITNMDSFKVPDYLKLTEKPSKSKLLLMDKEYFFNPVTRYSKGMSRGLYYKEQNDKFCGTFYYLEPESTTYLLYENPLIGRTKSEVFLNLVDDRNKWLKEVKLATDYINSEWYNQIFETRLIKTVEINGKISKKYEGRILGYAKEDKLDQPICILAKEKGFDVVIFEFMVGSHQIVTEILDVRDRGTSFRHLAYLETD